MAAATNPTACLIEALAALGHDCRVVARISVFGETEQVRYLEELAARGIQAHASGGVVRFTRTAVCHVRVVAHANLRAVFAAAVEEFQPDVILASTDDPAQLLLEVATSGPLRRPARA